MLKTMEVISMDLKSSQLQVFNNCWRKEEDRGKEEGGHEGRQIRETMSQWRVLSPGTESS